MKKQNYFKAVNEYSKAYDRSTPYHGRQVHPQGAANSERVLCWGLAKLITRLPSIHETVSWTPSTE